MADLAIRVENLSKQYRIGRRQSYKTFRESITGLLTAPLRRFQNSTEDSAHTSFWALDGVSFEVKPGEVVGIIGRNGAGKSTLLKVLSRITDPTRGRVEIHGRVGSLLEVGTGFHPELTGRENVFLNGAILGMKRAEIEAKFSEIVEFAEIEKFLDTPVKHYSSGMYTRLAFAVAAHLEPEILVVDEVLAVGDAGFQKKCMGKIGDVARHGRTVLFVSHNMAAISKLCTRTIVLNKGRVMVDGSCESGIAAYIKSFSEEKGTDLRTSKAREGVGRVRFTQIRYENEHGEPIEIGMSGETLIVALDYESQDEEPLSNVRVSVGFNDQLGQVLFLCSSELTTPHTIQCPPSGTIRCVIPKLPLSGSEYILSPFLEVNGEVQDYIHLGVLIPVEDGDFYGTGRLYPTGWQGKGVLVPHYWLPPGSESR